MAIISKLNQTDIVMEADEGNVIELAPGGIKPVIGGGGALPSVEYDPDVDIKGTNRADVLEGRDIHDEMYGYDGNDFIFGRGGNDWITGGAGADMIDGGDGDGDISLYLDSPERVVVDLALGRGWWGTANGDTLVNIEDVAGSYYNDVLIGNSGDNNLHGLDGDDRLAGGAGADWLVGGAGIDVADYTDSMVGVSVNLVAGRGYGGTAEGDTLEGIEDLHGSPYNDNLIGNDAANYFQAGAGDDVLKGGGGADTLLGGVGIDTVSYDGSDGVFVSLNDGLAAHGDAEGDRLYGIENLTGSRGADNLWGDAWDNVLNGMMGDDSLKGYGGADTLLGGDGNDLLEGMGGTDTLRGGLGGDHFIWNSNDDFGLTAATADLIQDFNAAEGDLIALGAVDANTYAAGNQAFTFIGAAAFSGTPGEINYVYSGGDTLIQLQTGMGTDVEGVIRLSGIHTPNASWFVL